MHSNVEQVIKEELYNVLEWNNDIVLDENQHFMELGMDSLMSVELENRIQHRLKGACKLDPLEMIDCTNFKTLVSYVKRKLED